MIGLIGEPDRQERLAKSFGKALFECLLEATELIPVACAVLLCLGLCLFVCAAGVAVYHLMFDPNAVDVASRLDLLSIDPDKLFPRS
jgi:hypothetical protein